MANTIITPSVIAKEGLMILKNSMVFGANCHREYKNEFVKVGDTVTIRRPVRFTVTDGVTRSNQNVTETSTSIVINKRKHISWNFLTADLTLSIEEYSKRYIQPAMVQLANQVDEDMAALYKGLYFSVGTPGTTPATFGALADAAEKLDFAAAPSNGMRNMVVDPAAKWGLADGLKALFDAGGTDQKQMIRAGYLGRLAEFQLFGDQNIVKHTVGAHGGTPLVNDASFTAGADTALSMDVTTDGWTASTAVLKEGDIFTIAGVNSVNPKNRQSTGQLQQFVCTEDGTSDGTGNLVINVAPALRASGQYQTVDALPADDAAITVLGTASTQYAQNMGYHKNCLGLVMCPLELPDGAAYKARATSDGMSVRVVKDYDIDADTDIIRLDILYGTKVLYPELGVRLWG